MYGGQGKESSVGGTEGVGRLVLERVSVEWHFGMFEFYLGMFEFHLGMFEFVLCGRWNCEMNTPDYQMPKNSHQIS